MKERKANEFGAPVPSPGSKTQERLGEEPEVCEVGIEDILRKKDEKRGRVDPRKDAYERDFQSRFVFSERVAQALINALIALRDKAIGMAVRLPIAAKASESPVFIECEGLVRLTLLCHIRVDQAGAVYCSPIDIGMSRNGGRIVRTQFEPTKSHARPGKFGFPEKQFDIDLAKFKAAIEALAHQV
jgi:hypothetical protein